MNIEIQPYKIHSAFNPVLVYVSLSDGEMSTDARATIALEGYPVELYQYQYSEFHEGMAEFDLSGTVKRLFEDRAEDTTPATPRTKVNTLFAFRYHVVIEAEGAHPAYTDFLTAINAVVQIGESSNMARNGDIFLTGFERLKKYPGYPLGVSYLNVDGSTYIWLNGVPVADTPILDILFEIDIPDGTKSVDSSENKYMEALTTNSGEPVTTNSGEQVYVNNGTDPGALVSIAVDNDSVPDSPFYVRWINNLGAREYFMFSFRQTFERGLENDTLFFPFVRYQGTAKGYTGRAYAEGRELITVGHAPLNDREFDTVSRIVYSPNIEWYNEKLGKWLTLTVDGTDISKDTRAATRVIEITFNLPKPQLQF